MLAKMGAYVGCHGRCPHAYTMERELAHRIIRAVRMHPELEMVYAGVNGDYLDSKDDALCDWLTNGYKFNVIRVKDAGAGGAVVKISIYKKEESRQPPGTYMMSSGTRLRWPAPVICGWTAWLGM